VSEAAGHQPANRHSILAVSRVSAESEALMVHHVKDVDPDEPDDDEDNTDGLDDGGGMDDDDRDDDEEELVEAHTVQF
jgi:hypothetical protein